MSVSVRQALMMVPFVIYFVIGMRLDSQALKHLRDPQRHFWFTPLYEPGLFTEEGESARRKALRFWLWGGFALLLYIVVF